MQYAVNSPTAVIRVNANTYYSLASGVWFAAPAPSGWACITASTASAQSRGANATSLPSLATNSGSRPSIAQALAIKIEQVSVKAKTAEGLGPVGEGQSMEARAVCLLYTLRRPIVPA